MNKFSFEDIKVCECIGQFEDEYVYDIEVDDDNHTFFANDILVHNSNYISFEEILATVENFNELGISKVDFVKQLYDLKLKSFFEKKMRSYAKKWNTENLQEFEMETISHSGIWLAKKKYMLDIAWTDRGISFEPQAKIKYSGVEIVQAKTSKYIRSKLKEIVEYIFRRGDKLDVGKLTLSLRKIKSKFKLMNIEDISLAKSMSDYDKYVIRDKGKIELRSKCPVHTRAAAIHNWLINSKPEYIHKYQLIKSGDKLKYYYTLNKSDALNVIGYLPGALPIEFVDKFPFDYDTMFEKIVIIPINRILEAIDKPLISKNLAVVRGLL